MVVRVSDGAGAGRHSELPSWGRHGDRTITGADIVTITPDQGVAAGDFAGAVRILQSGDAYVNVHTIRFPAGEIRGQVHTSGEGSG